MPAAAVRVRAIRGIPSLEVVADMGRRYSIEQITQLRVGPRLCSLSRVQPLCRRAEGNDYVTVRRLRDRAARRTAGGTALVNGPRGYPEPARFSSTSPT